VTGPLDRLTGSLDRLERVLADLPARVEEARRQAEQFAARQFEAESADGAVSAVVDGAGRLVGLSFSAAARRLDNYTLGERIVEAVNAALDGADAARDELVAAAVGEAGDRELTGMEELFAHRLGELERTLDAVEARLRRLER
jgi:DNA-binding protein YbaB